MDKKEQLWEQWYQYTVADNLLAVGGKWVCAVREDGTVATNIEEPQLRKIIESWRDIRSVVIELDCYTLEDIVSWVAALTTDGKVKIAERNTPEVLEATKWAGIRSIRNFDSTALLGLCYDGSLIVNDPYGIKKENLQGNKFKHFCNDGLETVGIDLQGTPVILYEKKAEEKGGITIRKPVRDILLPIRGEAVILDENGCCSIFGGPNIAKIHEVGGDLVLAYRMDGSIHCIRHGEPYDFAPVESFMLRYPREQVLCVKGTQWPNEIILTKSGKLFQSEEIDYMEYQWKPVFGEDFRLFRDFEAVVEKNKLSDKGPNKNGNIPDSGKENEKTPLMPELAEPKKTPAGKEYELQQMRKKLGVCPYCGGQFKRTMLIFKTCFRCGRPKDY